MAQEYAPDTFDWVAAQAKCRSASMFAQLQTSVAEDVRRRNDLRGEDDDWTLEMNGEESVFEVSRMVPSPFGGSKAVALVKFDREGRRIHVHGDGVDVDFTAVVALDASGACRFVVGEAIYSEWEIRRMALEELFFPDPHDEEDSI
jgi:hypothetical protein